MEGVEIRIPCEKLGIRFRNARVQETAGFRLPYVFRVLRNSKESLEVLDHHFLVRLVSEFHHYFSRGLSSIPSWERSHITKQGTFQSMIFRLYISHFGGISLEEWHAQLGRIFLKFFLAYSQCQLPKQLEHPFPVRRKFFIFFWL